MNLRYLAPCPIAFRGSAVVIGNFDGVHLGHQALIAAAKATGLRVIALSFTPHPRAFFTGEQIFTLTPDKEAVLHGYGVDALALCPFDAAFAALSPQEFIDKVLLNWLGAKAVFTGADFRFGAKRAGDSALLSAQPFTYQAVAPVLYAGEIISSSRVRAALKNGDIALATQLLGRPFRVSGEVIHGRKEGRTLGYPTANIVLAPETTLKYGIYAVRAGGVQGVASFGVRPMFDNGQALLETHFFDFAGDLYGQNLALDFIAYLRGEEKFESLAALITQMDKDSQQAKAILKEMPHV
jgi:riboflavin kinase / FMN adenylyltransferase